MIPSEKQVSESKICVKLVKEGSGSSANIKESLINLPNSLNHADLFVLQAAKVELDSVVTNSIILYNWLESNSILPELTQKINFEDVKATMKPENHHICLTTCDVAEQFQV